MLVQRKHIQHLMFFIDIAFCISSLFLALFIKYNKCPTFQEYLIHLKIFIPVIISWVLSMYIFYLYSIDVYLPAYNLLFRMFCCYLISAVIGISFFYVFSRRLTPKLIFLIYNSLVLGLLFMWHLLCKKFFTNKYFKNKYIFIGYTPDVKSLLELTKIKYYGNFIFEGIYDENSKYATIKTEQELEEYLFKRNIKTVVITSKYKLTPSLTNMLMDAMMNKTVFYSLPDFYELITRKIPISSISDGWILNKISKAECIIYKSIKRAADIIFSILILFITSPIWLLSTFIIPLESKGPVIFKQKRLGLHSKEFILYKFRSMREENNTYKYTTENDSRITKFGNFMRKTRIDELPQLINILKGDMSLIGPRPERPEYAIELQKQIPFYNQRLIVRPGITGWDQVSGEYHSPSTEDTYKKLQNDLYYIKNISLSLDFSIAMKTIATMFMREGI